MTRTDNRTNEQIVAEAMSGGNRAYSTRDVRVSAVVTALETAGRLVRDIDETELAEVISKNTFQAAWGECERAAEAVAAYLRETTMTTDNRTNGPTPEQVEAAAKALESFGVARPGYWREVARAALVAAQGAAPQAETLPETGNERRDDDGDPVSSGKHLRVLHQGGYVCDTCTNVLGLNVRWDHAVLRETHTPLPVEGES